MSDTESAVLSHSASVFFLAESTSIASRVGNKSGVVYRWIGQYNRYCTSFVLRQETNCLERGDYVRPTPCQSTPRFIRERC